MALFFRVNLGENGRSRERRERARNKEIPIKSTLKTTLWNKCYCIVLACKPAGVLGFRDLGVVWRREEARGDVVVPQGKHCGNRAGVAEECICMLKLLQLVSTIVV